MGFLIFLWNTFARLVWFLSFIVFEIAVFYFITKSIIEAGMPVLAGILTVVFIIWIIADIIIRVFIGGGKTLISWIFRF